MALSAEAQKKLQSLAQLLEKWLKHCSPSLLEMYPHLANSKEVMERSLVVINKKLQEGDQELSIMEDHGDLFLEWIGDEVDPFDSPLVLEYKSSFPIKNFKESKIKGKANFSFGEQELEGKILKASEWKDDYYHNVRYECSAIPPNDFKAGTIQVKVQVTYGDKKDAIEKTLELGGITTEGQAVLDFLEAFNIDKKLGAEPWNYQREKSTEIEQAQTMSQLLAFQQQLQEFLTARQALQQSYENFAHTEVLKGFIYNRAYEITAQKYFGGYWEEALPLGSASREKLDYLEHWKIHNAKQGQELTDQLQNTLNSINEKIEAIKAERALAEQNYGTAKEELQAQSSAGVELLDHIYTITKLDKQFEELKINYPIITGTEATDAHKLILQPQKTIQELQEKLQELKIAYTTASGQVEENSQQVLKNGNNLEEY